MKHQQEQDEAPVDPRWPKWRYHKSGKSKMVQSKREEDFLGPEWKDSPAAFGQVTYPHSDEYMARQDAKPEPAFDPSAEGKLFPGEDAAPKAKRGRPAKEG
jgi:hypothetical protein